MAVDMHYKIRAYLRYNGKTDMSRYQLNWVNGETTMGRWEYDDVPAPSHELLADVPQAHLDFESEVIHTRDIYRSTLQSVTSTSTVMKLSPMRMPSITTQGADGSVVLPTGLYKFLVVGHRVSNIPFELIIASTTNSIRRQVITSSESEFDFTAVKLWGREAEINITISLISRSSADLKMQLTLIIEKL